MVHSDVSTSAYDSANDSDGLIASEHQTYPVSFDDGGVGKIECKPGIIAYSVVYDNTG